MTKKETIASWGLSLPIVSAPMFLISSDHSVTAAIDAGIIGSVPALNQRSTEGLRAWLTTITEHRIRSAHPSIPYAVNLIVHKSNPRLMDDLRVCVELTVPIVITSLGAVPDLVEQVHAYGGLVFHDVTNAYHAQKAKDAGVDGLILVTAGAGGHAGSMHPFALVHEIRQFFDGILLLGGSISTGTDIAAALQLDVDLAYMGTRFINTEENNAPDRYKEMIIASTAKDIVYTDAVSGIPANFLLPSLEMAGISKEQLTQKGKIDFGHGLESEIKAWKTVWSAGHGVSQIDNILSTADLVRNLKTEFLEALRRQSANLDLYS